MTWREFRERLNRDLQDDDEVDYIDTTGIHNAAEITVERCEGKAKVY